MIKQQDLQSLQKGHRARLRKKFLDNQLTDYEILELLLTYAIPRRDVRNLSRQLYKKYGSIHDILTLSPESLMQNEGISENTVAFFKVIYKLITMEYKKSFNSAPIFHNYEKMVNYCKMLLLNKPIEEFHVFYLDSEYKLILDDLHSSGTIDWTAVYIREIVKKALALNAYHVLLLHNHPSGYTNFSSQDIQITQELQEMLNQLSINLYDHLLVSGDNVYSARNMRLLTDNNIS